MSDKRKVSTDALETLGTIINESEKRDAIHLAVEPIIAASKLFPGQDVGIIEGKADVCDKPLGIVDPFLKHPVYPGQYFWLVVYPRRINSLRHVWDHPDFPEESNNIQNKPDFKESEDWIKSLAESLDIGYENLMRGAENFIKNDFYLVEGETLEDEMTPPEFWKHYQVVTKKQVPLEKQRNFFGCSC
jgi:hypothetical protein